MARIQIPDFDEDEEPAKTCGFCRSADAVAFFDNAYCPLAACAGCALELAPFVARGAAARAKGRCRMTEDALSGFLDLTGWYWGAFTWGEHVNAAAIVQHVEDVVEQARDWRRRSELAAQAGEEVQEDDG